MYTVKLGDIIIGTTGFEHADPSMGVVFGAIKGNVKKFDYDYIKNYCKTKGIRIQYDDPSDKIISTEVIPELKVYNKNDIEIVGQGSNIEGSNDEGFVLTILGIDGSIFKNEFPNHLLNYGL